jgi:hypothetical protein
MLVQRIVRAACLDPTLYDDVEKDEKTGRDAQMAVIVIVAVGVVGGALGAILSGDFADLIPITLGLALQGVLGWLAWSATAYYAGIRLLGGKSTMTATRRIGAFALIPTVLAPLFFFPGPSNLTGVILTPWLLATGYAASRPLVGPQPKLAVIATVYSFLAYVFVGFILGALRLGAAFGL